MTDDVVFSAKVLGWYQSILVNDTLLTRCPGHAISFINDSQALVAFGK